MVVVVMMMVVMMMVVMVMMMVMMMIIMVMMMMMMMMMMIMIMMIMMMMVVVGDVLVLSNHSQLREWGTPVARDGALRRGGCSVRCRCCGCASNPRVALHTHQVSLTPIHLTPAVGSPTHHPPTHPPTENLLVLWSTSAWLEILCTARKMHAAIAGCSALKDAWKVGLPAQPNRCHQ
jgi:hypothetical protein